MKPETIAIHLSNQVNDLNHPVIQPITLSTTFLHGDESLIYSRMENPNRRTLESVMAALEKGSDAAAFASGNAAGMAIFQALPLGAHIIVPLDMYHGLQKQLREIVNDKLDISFVDMTDLDKLRSAIKPDTELIWLESPSNPLIQISDLRKIGVLAKERNIRLVCDNTFATPILQNPMEFGADLVMHSATKYIGGHSDVLGGILVTRKKDAFWEKIKTIQAIGGAVPSAFDCYLLCRSIKTLPYRIKGHCENAMAIATFLESHDEIEKVYYPGLASDPGHQVARSQMTGFGGMLSFLIRGDANRADRFVSSLKLFSNATSLGGVESLIERRARVEGPDSKSAENLIRMSVGLENVEDLIADLNSALT
ncbi:trans-sulfuration enzyme family protein [Lunatibacter salilacus]|uniref:trans-sulfuration enzyme family protein n=1 Tax=Lunatibacter salilacus TaxID=2483804 RepID=UPI00131C6959|nr:aminotransferase class I/II-fold pyridoxal phosphate-dependent enzyme [Lunatibacter salilacus]